MKLRDDFLYNLSNNTVKKVIAIGSVILGVVFLAGCGQKSENQNQSTTNLPSIYVENKVVANIGCGQIKDIDGNIYDTVLIGTQCWMASNMNVGDKIDGKNNPSDNKKIEKWCYDNIDANCASEGGLYSWGETMQYSNKQGAQDICPTDWHIPTDAEWQTLEAYLIKLGKGVNSGLNFVLAGSCYTDGMFSYRNMVASFWSSTSKGKNALDGDIALGRDIYSGDALPYSHPYSQVYGLSVRCIKD